MAPFRSKEKKLDMDEKSGKKRQEKKDGPGLIEAIKRRMKTRERYLAGRDEAEKEAEEKGNSPPAIGHFDPQGIDLNKLKKPNKGREVENNAKELDRANEKGDELEEIIVSRWAEAKKILFMKDLATLQYEIKDEKEEKEEIKEQFVDLDKKVKDLSISESDFGDIKPVGLELYNNWIISFELISILLLIALVGSVVLAKKRKSKISEED